MSNSSKNRNKESVQQPPTHGFSREWYKRQPESERKLIENVILFLFFIIAAMIFAIVQEPDDSAYFKAHGVLAFICLIAFLLLLIRRKDILQLVRNLWQAITQFNVTRLPEITDAIFMVCVLLTAISVLFVIDLAFFSNYGIRIGAVVAVGLFKVLKNVFKSFKN